MSRAVPWPAEEDLPRPRRRVTDRVDLRAVIVGVVAAVLAVVLGLAAPDGLLLGLVAYVITLVGLTLEAGRSHVWPTVDLTETDGTRREIAALTWTFVGREGRVSEAAIRRLRPLAERRLLRHGLSLPVPLGPALAALDDPRRDQARALLGDRVWATLTGPGGYLPTFTEIAHCVDVLERLGPPTPTERPQP